jgi:hypothetical protein
MTFPIDYWVVVGNSCGQVTSAHATVTPVLTTPTGLTATATGNGSILISWNATADADHYELERKSSGGAFTQIGTPNGNSYTDVGIGTNVTYVYRVRSSDAFSTVFSTYSNNDLATTITFSVLTSGESLIQSLHFDEVLTGINLVRAANGSPPLSWSAILPVGKPAPGPGVLVFREHLTSLRTYMDLAVQALGIATTGYTDPVVDGTVLIKAAHVFELRSRTQ